MKIQIVSDLHLEFSHLKIKRTDCDVLVLPGDIVVAAQLHKLRNICREKECPIVYVTGNHEYYGGIIDEVDAAIKEIEQEFDHFHFLKNESVVIDDVRFLGGTLWSNFDLSGNPQAFAHMVKRGISDFHRVRIDPVRLFNGDHCRNFNLEARAYLAEELTKPFEGKSVVVTHFCPSPKCIVPMFEGSPLNPYFTCNCEDLMENDIALWIHGHTHASIDVQCNGTRIVANPRGYHTENKQFNNKLVVEI